MPNRRALLAAAVLLSGAMYGQSPAGGSSTSPGSTGPAANDPMQSSSSTMGSTRTGSSSGGSSYGTSTSSGMTGNQSGSMSTSGTSTHKLGWGDRRFVTKAADSGQMEVQIAQLAAQKATNPDVRRFAQQLVDRHSQVNSQLMQIASSKNVKIDQEDTTRDRSYRRLSNASGTEFDREFVAMMVDEHEKEIKLYEKAANNAKDQEVRQFASTTLPHLRQHLTQVQQLQRSVMPTGREDESSGFRSSSGSSSSGSTTSDMSGSSSGMNSSSSSGMSGSSSGTTGSSGMSGSSSQGSGSSSGNTSSGSSGSGTRTY